MPYASVSELPQSVRDALPEHGQQIFLSAFNSAYDSDKDEGSANAIAWAAVKRSYHKNDEGMWVRKAEETDNLYPFDNLAEFSDAYNVTLQTLETRHPHPDYPDGLFYPTDAFSGTESAWESRDLVIFVPPGKKVEHVNHAAFSNDPIGEVNRLGYRVAGRLKNTRIDNGSGMPRVSAQVVLDDTEARNFADKRLLGLSDAFDARISPDGKITGKIEPNHVLLFLKCAQKPDGFCGIPNDRGAEFNNLKGIGNMADDETKGMLSKIMEAVSPKENPLQKAVDSLTAEVQKRDAQIDALTKEVTALKADKQALDNLRAEQEKTKKDAQWAQIKNLYKPGMFHKPEDEAARRAEFENDPVVFQLANVGNLQTAKPTPAQGASAVGNLGDPDAPVDVVALRGEYDPLTHTFKGMN